MNLTEKDMISYKYNCQYCGKNFKNIGNLANHHRNNCYWNPHSGSQETLHKKPFPCDSCGAAYMQERRLRYHKRHECGLIHTCEICNNTFLHRSSLNEHKKRCV